MLRLWKALPPEIRRRAHLGAQALSRGLVPIWVALAWRRGAPVASGDPLVVLGLLRSTIGIGRGARLFLQALQAEGFDAAGLDATAWAKVKAELPEPPAPAIRGPGAVVISHLNPPELGKVLEATRGRFLRRARHVGYWAWEQSLAPEAWRPSFRYVDAVWLPSTFAADAMARIAPPEVPLVVIPHPVAVGEITADRGRFNLPEDQCLVLCAFDLKSTAARKNPWGALEAFKRASPAPGSATLVCKVSGSAAEPELFARLAAAVLRRADVRLIDEALSEEDMTRLIASVDIVLSPHRAEGFGLVLAEAMLLGKAVVATGWSGNMDFMTAETGALIRYELTPAVDPQGMYDARSSWADPDLDHASLLLKTLIEDADGREALGRRARLHAEHVFDRKRWAARVRQALYGASLPPP